jgi:hypothetical protein
MEAFDLIVLFILLVVAIVGTATAIMVMYEKDFTGGLRIFLVLLGTSITAISLAAIYHTANAYAIALGRSEWRLVDNGDKSRTWRLVEKTKPTTMPVEK